MPLWRILMASSHDQTGDRLQAVLDAALDCIVCMDVHGLIQEFNPAAEKAFGYVRGGTHTSDLLEDQ